jgi:hypothetical protein
MRCKHLCGVACCAVSKGSVSRPAHVRVAVLALALGVHSSAAVPRPSGSSLMPLRCAHQVPELRQCIVGGARVDRPSLHKNWFGWSKSVDHPLLRESWSAVYSAQRHQGGGSGARPQRGTAAELSTPSACSPYKTCRALPPPSTPDLLPVQDLPRTTGSQGAADLLSYKTKVAPARPEIPALHDLQMLSTCSQVLRFGALGVEFDLQAQVVH